MKIAILVNLSKTKAIECSKNISELFNSKGAEVLMLKDCEDSFENYNISYYDTLEQIFETCDIAVTVGGDGTIIHNAKYAANANKPLIGVNVGRLGFAADVEPEHIDELLNLLTGDYNIQNRMLLEVEVLHSNGTSESFIAVNDAIVARGQMSRIIDLTVFLNDSKITTYRADGLLFSTPTGSTAYALSAGGPVIYPEMECILITPVCPHSLISRPVLLNSDANLSVKVKAPENASIILTIDGEINITLTDSDIVKIKKSDKNLKLLSLYKRNFYQLLNEKLKEREN
ncbi:MAG: NAD(+)/NADH kinase [Ruminococcus sp.]